MANIKNITAREILNSKGTPAVETTVLLDNGIQGIASCPVGASLGRYEAASGYDAYGQGQSGMSMLSVIQNIQGIIAPKLLGIDITNQPQIDKTMIAVDGTQNKSVLGANATISVSMASARAGAITHNLPLFSYLQSFVPTKNSYKIPLPLFTMLSGGVLGLGTPNFQEFLIMPSSATAYKQSLEIGTKLYPALQSVLREKKSSGFVSDDGGLIAPTGANIDSLSIISDTLQKISLRLGFDVFMGINAAASTFYRAKQYKIADKDAALPAKNLTDYYEQIIKQFSLLYLEDPFSEDDWDGWEEITARLSNQVIIAAGDLTVTNPYRLQMAIAKKAATAIVIKPNQIGTIIETLAVCEVAKSSGYKVIVSNRSFETNDDFIADFAVAVGADYVKCGGLARGEHVAKYNRLSFIESMLHK